MNKKAIWVIIGLMSTALIGIVWMQMTWIRDSIQISEKKFEKDVFDALKDVVDRLEMAEWTKVTNMVNGYEQRFMSNQTVTSDGKIVQYSFKEFVRTNNRIPEEKIADLLDPKCPCADCKKSRQETREILMNIQRGNTWQRFFQQQQVAPLDQRIDLAHLDKILRAALRNSGITIDYNYGVFWNRINDFVIKDNAYLFADGSPKVTHISGYDNLTSSEYHVDLFPQDNTSPGLLMIYFPARATAIWDTVWPNLLASILFTCIILLCFVYTIQVIFRQKKVSEMKTDFINNMTHEFKTPIATISLATDSITSPMILNNSEKVKRFADIIRQENKRMLSQVEKVLQMALLDKQDFKLKLTDINLHDVINQAVGHANLQVEKKEGIVTADLQAKNPVVEGDLTHISNIVHNLLDNANKYSPDKPQISVHTHNVGNGVEIIVKDNGIGMTKEALKHIFDKFYRVHTGNLHDVKGFGLGLSYVKAMITAHKGHIDVKSELGKGSSFIIFLPFRINS